MKTLIEAELTNFSFKASLSIDYLIVREQFIESICNLLRCVFYLDIEAKKLGQGYTQAVVM